jgi:hypothetical protein
MITNRLLKYLSYSGLIFFLSCSDNPNGDSFNDYFSETELIEIQGKEVPLIVQGNPLSYMFNMAFFDSLILVNEYPDNEYTYKLIDLRNNTVSPFGKKGEGPNELLTDAFSFSFDHNTSRLFLTDNIHYYVHDVRNLKKNEYDPIEKFTIDQKETRFVSSTVHVDGYIVGSMYHKRFCAYNIEREKFIEKVEYEGGPSMALANQAFYMNHPTGRKVVYCMSRVPEFGIIEIKDGDLLINKFSWGKTKLGVQHGEGTMAVLDNDEAKFEFMSVATSEDHIYILYSGKKPASNTRDDRVSAALTNIIYVLDWNGNPLKRYQIDKYLRSIAIDGKTNTLYGSSYEENPSLISYKLK